MEKINTKTLEGRYIIKCALDPEQRKKFIEGGWFEATHSFKSEGTDKGDFDITPEMIEAFALNFKNNVVRRWPDANGKFRLKINLEHFYSTKAGWIIDVMTGQKILSNGEQVRTLLVKPQWMPDAAMAIEKGEFEFFSIEFERTYEDDQNGQTFKNVLTGGALTNDPFVMELYPVALSTLYNQHVEAEALAQKQKEDEDKQNEIDKLNKKEADEMEKLTIALKGLGVKLSDTPSDAEVIEAYKLAMDGKASAEKELLTVKTEKEAVDKKLTAAEKELADVKEKADAEAKTAVLEQAVKELKFSPDECKPEGVFGKLVNKDIELSKEFLKAAPERFKKADVKPDPKDAVKDGEFDFSAFDLSKTESYNEALKAYAKHKDISVLKADAELSIQKTKQKLAKEVK